MASATPLAIGFSEDAISFDGKTVTFPSTREDLVGAIGEPDRFDHDDGEEILIWDRHGLYAFEDAKTKKLVFFAFTFYKAGYTFAPESPFAGRITAGKMTITPDTTMAELEASEYAAGELFPFELSVGGNKIVVEIGDTIQEVAIGTEERF